MVWNREQVAEFTANLFRERKTKALPFHDIRDALMKEADVAIREASGMLRRNPAIITQVEPRTYKRIATFQPNYREILSQSTGRILRKKATLGEKLDTVLKEVLEARPDQQMPLSELVSLLEHKYGYRNKTVYRYITCSDLVDKVIIPGTRIKLCQLKGKVGLAFPQLAKISNATLCESLDKAIKDLTEEDIDIGLFQFGREFEVIIKKALVKGDAKGKVTLSQQLKKPPTAWKLIDMVDCAKNNGLITDLGVANLLRQERNNQAHGSRPSLAERRALMNSAQYLAGLYIDYIILFDEFAQNLG